MQDLQSGEGAMLRSEPQRAGAADGFRLWSMCFALFGIQIVWGLQNANTSRIFQALGADVAELPLLWIAGPITGLIVQPIIGHLSDHSRSRHGKRRSEEHTSELQSLMRISYAVFSLKTKIHQTTPIKIT